MTEEKCIGYIQLTFIDDANNEAIIIGGAGFVTQQAWDTAWIDLERFDGDSSFMADRLDADHDIIEDRVISAETCEKLMGKPIAELIASGRAELAKELTNYGMAA